MFSDEYHGGDLRTEFIDFLSAIRSALCGRGDVR